MMFERFTERARQVVILAQDEARAYGYPYITTAHLVAGLLREENGLAARVLEGRIELADVRKAFGEGGNPLEAEAQPQFTELSKKVLQLALREALSLGHNYIGTEHILLGLIRFCQGEKLALYPGATIDLDQLRDVTMYVIKGPRRETKQERHARYAEGFECLRAWAMDEAHITQSVRMHEPTYKNPGELRKDVRRLLSLLDAEAALEADGK